jgi:hypothetical protein
MLRSRFGKPQDFKATCLLASDSSRMIKSKLAVQRASRHMMNMSQLDDIRGTCCSCCLAAIAEPRLSRVVATRRWVDRSMSKTRGRHCPYSRNGANGDSHALRPATSRRDFETCRGCVLVEKSSLVPRHSVCCDSDNGASLCAEVAAALLELSLRPSSEFQQRPCYSYG